MAIKTENKSDGVINHPAKDKHQDVKSSARKRGYNDLREHLDALDREGLLLRVSRKVQKETDIHTLVRWQFVGGIPEEDRKAFLFDNVTDAQGREYQHPVVVAALAANPKMYAIGLGCKVDEISDKWKSALDNPVPPITVEDGEDVPAQEVVMTGDQLKREGGGFDRFPVPISTPGFDVAPFTTCSHWFTNDPETGIRNVGNYRGQIKARNKVGIRLGHQQHLRVHWNKARKKGEPLQAASSSARPPSYPTRPCRKYLSGSMRLPSPADWPENQSGW